MEIRDFSYRAEVHIAALECMRTQDLKRTILKMFGDNEFYGYDVSKKLAISGVKVELSRLYRVLNKMLKEGFLQARWERSRFGPRKRIYRLGRKGREELDNILLDAIATVHSFYGAYLMSLAPKVRVLDDLIRLLTHQLKRDANITYLIIKKTGMHERMIRNLQGRVPQGQVLLVKPGSVAMDLSLDKSTILDGKYDDIPLKDGYADLLVVIDLPKKDLLEPALKEWHRVVGKNGKVAILTPTVLIHEYEDPLTIGDFVERHEHEIIEKGERVEWEYLQGRLNRFFRKVEERQIVHMSVILTSEPSSPHQ